MEGLISLLLFAAFFYLMMRFGCGAHMVHGHGGGRDAGARHKDPVCGKEVDPQQGYGKMHKGTLYRFCSRKCLDAFEAEPARYLQSTNEEES